MCLKQMLENVSVLYVEDDEVTQIVVRQMLKNLVGKVYTASDGEEGLKMFQKHKPEIVITDLKMPKVDGISLIKEIRAIDAQCGILITTEVNELNHILESIDIGIDKYMVKPLDQKMLEEALSSVLRKVVQRTVQSKEINSIAGMEKEWRVSVGDEIKGKLSTFLKKMTKKGPTTIHVLVKDQNVYISIKGALTNFEKALLINSTNSMMVSFNRELLYKEYRETLEEFVSEALKFESSLQSVNVEPLTDEEELVFSFNIA